MTKNNTINEITTEETLKHKSSYILIDVRREDEWYGELKHIREAKLISLGEDFSSFLSTANKEKTYVIICRSGNRSSKATLEAQNLGFKKVYNMVGGMLAWNEKTPLV